MALHRPQLTRSWQGEGSGDPRQQQPSRGQFPNSGPVSTVLSANVTHPPGRVPSPRAPPAALGAPCTWDVSLWKKVSCLSTPTSYVPQGKVQIFLSWESGLEAPQQSQCSCYRRGPRHTTPPVLQSPPWTGTQEGPHRNWGRSLPTPPQAGLLSCPERPPARASEGPEATVLNASWTIKGCTHSRSQE